MKITISEKAKDLTLPKILGLLLMSYLQPGRTRVSSSLNLEKLLTQKRVKKK